MSATAEDPILDVSDLRVASGTTELLHGIDLRVARGERVGLIGESGSGKSLTCLSVTGLLPPGLTASGRVTLRGVEGNVLRARESRLAPVRGQGVSMVFQEPMTALDPLQRVGAHVAEVLTLHGRSRRGADVDRRVVELLAAVGIPEPERAVHAFPHQLSGGQRQRVMLAIAMANSPELLLADEPTTALDVTVQSQVLALMREQVERAGSSLLFITHDLAVVAEVCERVVVMRSGAVVEEGPLEEVFRDPRDDYTKALLAASRLETGVSTGPRGRRGAGRGATSRSTGPALSRAETTEGAVSVEWTADGAVTEPGASAAAAGEEHRALAPADPGSLGLPAAPDEQAPLIAVREVERVYTRRGRGTRPAQRIQALKGVSFDVRPGQHFGIVGESGCGKSTLLRILVGLDRATSGSVRIAGEEIVGVPERRLRRLRSTAQIVFQDPVGSLDPRMRIEDVVAEPLRGVAREERRARVSRLLEQVGLPAGAIDRYPHEFSGGQHQRVAIARALIDNPRVLLADEAVSALDVSARAQVLGLLDELVEAYGLTLVFVSHDLHVVRRLCDTVSVMSAGRIVECGPTDAVYDSPLHPYTKRLIEAIPTLSPAGAA